MLAAAAGLAALPAPAFAGWGAPQLVSVDNGRLEQADGASSAIALSGDGRWVVFQTRATNFFADGDADPFGRMRQGGIFRFDRSTGALALVADGDELDELTGELLRRGASAPSVSDDGRFVAFSSAQPLAPQDANDNVDVYVRDMVVPLAAERSAGGAYALVSARDGSEEPARYAVHAAPLPGRNPGASVYPGHAISADGTRVAFRTTELASDLPDRAELDAPAGSVFVRDLAARRTVLVTARSDGAGSAGGALAPVVLSRDGSTVAWVGENGPAQTAMLPGEGTDAAQRFYLWRRPLDPGATTRRVTGLADPDDPGCPAGAGVSVNPTASGPCYGPLTDPESSVGDIGSRAPALSADGWTVAFLTGAASRPSAADDTFLDAFLTSMRPGRSRKAATRAVTKGTTSSNARANGDVESIALSADGSRLLLVSTRREFLPPAPSLVGPARPSAPISSELYVLDTAGAGALRRPLVPGGELSGAVDPNPALSADGRTLALVTRAANLVPGDANELADVFAVQEVDDAPNAPPPAGLGADAIDLTVGSDADEGFSARVTARPDGTLLVRATAPEAGALRAVARTRPARARGRRKRPRQVSTARASATRRATVRLVLRLRERDRAAVLAGTRLPVRVAVTLTPARRGARERTTTLIASFRAARRAAPGVRRAAARAAPAPRRAARRTSRRAAARRR